MTTEVCPSLLDLHAGFNKAERSSVFYKVNPAFLAINLLATVEINSPLYVFLHGGYTCMTGVHARWQKHQGAPRSTSSQHSCSISSFD
uniref:Uncharacterized protein n=1 Tax=Triticum urartu TaxID=4572 RepID=A0A8R7PW38_TRIUA